MKNEKLRMFYCFLTSFEAFDFSINELLIHSLCLPSPLEVVHIKKDHELYRVFDISGNFAAEVTLNRARLNERPKRLFFVSRKVFCCCRFYSYVTDSNLTKNKIS